MTMHRQTPQSSYNERIGLLTRASLIAQNALLCCVPKCSFWLADPEVVSSSWRKIRGKFTQLVNHAKESPNIGNILWLFYLHNGSYLLRIGLHSNITLNKEKCVFSTNRVKFLGQVLSDSD